MKAAIAAVASDAWTTIQYTDAVFDEQTGRWISSAEPQQTSGRLVIRRIRDLTVKNGVRGRERRIFPAQQDVEPHAAMCRRGSLERAPQR